MNVLIVPMFALSRMGGPWSRAQAIADAFEQAGHHVVLGVSDDGNCANPCVPDILQLPVPSPLGLPMRVASRTFPMAEKLGISGRKPVRSFEEVLWLTGALAYEYERESVAAICDAIAGRDIDAVYSEYSLPAIIAAKACGAPVFGSFSYTTQTSYASEPAKAEGVRKLASELGLPSVESSLELFDWLERRFVPSCPELEPIQDGGVEFVGFLRESADVAEGERDCIVVYLGSGSVPQAKIEKAVIEAFGGHNENVYVAGCKGQRQEGNVRFAPRFDFSELLPHARCFVHHGGQNSTMDALAYAVPQVIVPGKVFERIYNATSVERAGAGLSLDGFNAQALVGACKRVSDEPSFGENAQSLRGTLASLGGASRIVESITKEGQSLFGYSCR